MPARNSIGAKRAWAELVWEGSEYPASLASAALLYSVITWAPAFLIRSHGMSTGEIGTWLALIFGVGGGIGTIAGGVLADRWAASDLRGRSYVPCLAMLALFNIVFLLIPIDASLT